MEFPEVYNDIANMHKSARPNQLNVSPAPSFEKLNKLKNRIKEVISPPKSASSSLQSLKENASKQHTPSSSDNDLSESTPLVALKGQEQKPIIKSDTVVVRGKKDTEVIPTSIVRRSTMEKQQRKGNAETSAFVHGSPQVAKAKAYRGSVSFDEAKDEVKKMGSSDGDLKRNLTAPKDLDRSDSVSEGQLVEVITSTETVL